MSSITRQISFLLLVRIIVIATPLAIAQSAHTLLQQSQMKSEAELTPEEQKIIELNRIDQLSRFMAADESGAAEDVKASRTPRKPWNLSKILNISENESSLIRSIMYQAYHRLIAIDDQQNSDGLRSLSLHERAEKRNQIQILKYKICEETLNSLKQQLGKEDFGKLDAVLRLQYPWYPPRIVNSPNAVTANPPSEVRP